MVIKAAVLVTKEQQAMLYWLHEVWLVAHQLVKSEPVQIMMAKFAFAVHRERHLIHDRHSAVPQAHDAICFLRIDFARFSGFTAKNDRKASSQQLHLILYQLPGTAAVFRYSTDTSVGLMDSM